MKKLLRGLCILWAMCLLMGGALGEDRVMLDCDMAYMSDDALALTLLAGLDARGDVDLLGVTLVGGNVFTQTAVEGEVCGMDNAAALLEALDREDISVICGADIPAGITLDTLDAVVDYFENATYLQWGDGWGAIHDFDAVDSETLSDSDEAARALVAAARENPGELVVFAVGPATNLARAIRMDGEFVQNVKAVYYMGGAFGAECEGLTEEGDTVSCVGGANVTPYAEYNLIYDPQAFYECVTAGFDAFYIFPGELTVDAPEDILELLEQGETSAAAAWADLYREGLPEYPYWDPLTVYAYACPEGITEEEEAYVTVVTDRDSAEFGHTIAIDDATYAALSQEDKQDYGPAVIIRSTEGFWDWAVPLMCG